LKLDKVKTVYWKRGKLAKYRHTRQLVQRTFGHAMNLSMSKSNGFWSRPGESKFELLIFFSKWKSRGSRYRVSYGSTLKLPGRRRVCSVYTDYTKGNHVSH